MFLFQNNTALTALSKELCDDLNKFQIVLVSYPRIRVPNCNVVTGVV